MSAFVHSNPAPRTPVVIVTCLFFITLGLILCAAATSSFAMPTGQSGFLAKQALENSIVTKVYVRRGRAVRGRTVVGPRSGVYHGRAVVRGGARGGWVRPSRYWWPAGGAIAAGAAIGVVSAATAAAWAGAPPAPGYCWYYTDPGRRQGFWDACR